MESIYDQILQTLKKRQHGTLASIIHRKGSVPRREGAHLFLTGKNEVIGTIGGGGLEAEVIKIAREVCIPNEGHLQSFTLVEGDDPSDMVCGGNITVLVEPVFPGDEAIYDFITSSTGNHTSCCLIRLLRHRKPNSQAVELGPKGAVKADGTHLFSIPVDEELRKQLVTWAQIILKETNQKIRILAPDSIGITRPEKWEMFVFEALQVLPRLVIFGGGHLSQALSKMATLCNFQVEVIDDRDEFANKARFPGAHRVLCLPNYSNISDLITFDSHTFVVIATRGHRFDETVLAQVILHELPYIGMVGSKQKNDIVFERLRERGVSRSRVKRVHAPIGLPIHSETPEEIAVSILAEIIQVRGEKRKRN